MKRVSKLYKTFNTMLLMGLMVITLSTNAYSEDSVAAEPAAENINASASPISLLGTQGDAAFNYYVETGLIQLAIATGNAALLTDAAILTRQGEVDLHRTHNSGVTAWAMLNKAIMLASASGDKATLSRIQSYLKSQDASDAKPMLESIERATQLASASRTVEDEALTKAKTESPIAAALVALLDQAETLNDKQTLELAKRSIADQKELPESVAAALQKRIDSVQQSASEVTPQDELFGQLASPSRNQILHAMVGAWKDPKGSVYFFQPGQENVNGWIKGQMIAGLGQVNNYSIFYSTASSGTLNFRVPQGIEVTLTFKFVNGNQMRWFYGGENLLMTR